MSDIGRRFAVSGTIMTMAGTIDASAMLIGNGTIEAVGGPELLARAHSEGLPLYELRDEEVVLPGFVDAHVHLAHLSLGVGRGIDCRVPIVRTIDDVLARLSDGLASGKTSGGWLIGYGNLFYDQKLAEHRLPTRTELDRVSRTVPIVLHCGGHTSVLNSIALELAQVDRFLGGQGGAWGAPVVEVDKHGHPTGMVAEIDNLLPIPEPDEDELRSYLDSTFRDYFTKVGVTTIGEMAESQESVALMDELVANGSLAGRIAVYAMAPSMLPLGKACEWAAGYSGRASGDRLRVMGIKMFADGGYSSRSAASRSPYVADHSPRPGYSGKLNLPRHQVRDAVIATRESGLRLAVHANGTHAQDEVIAGVLAAGDPHAHPPVRVEHLGNFVPDRHSIAEWRAANVLPVTQPGFLNTFIGDYLPMLLGDAGSTGRLPLRTILDEGVIPVISSDTGLGTEIGESSPLFTIWSAVARRSYWGIHVEPHETISVSEALRLHTIAAAEAIGMGHLIGSLEPGKRADFVVLGRDPRAVDHDALREVAVRSVWLDGLEVFAEH
jgi:predicted amidohydrolase YtcJ